MVFANVFSGPMLQGVLLALLFMLLRAFIDQGKGLLGEIAAVTFPIAVAATMLLVSMENFTIIRFGSALSGVIQVEFLAVQVFVAIRLRERLYQGDSLQLADLFRITTIVSLAVFVFTSLRFEEFVIPALICLMAFIGSELATDELSDSAMIRSTRVRAIIFASCLLAMVIATVTLGLEILWPPIFGPHRALLVLMAAIALLLPQFVVAPILTFAFDHSQFFQSMAHRFTAWRFNISRPEESIFHRPFFNLWRFPKRVCYLNHGSFGAVPNYLHNEQQRIRRACKRQPTDWFVRQMEKKWFAARFRLSVWLGVKEESIAFCENATAAMNELAGWFPLQPGDEVLLNDHEYGAVKRVWQRRCDSSGARLVVVTLPMPLQTQEQITTAILSQCNDRTRLVVVSHITSPTAILMPIHKICAELRLRGIASCVDGPHALLQQPLKLHRLGCDFYTASCHKWLCAPLGSGFLYVAPEWESLCQPARLSWGRLLPNKPNNWSEELIWTGTRDNSPFLTIPAAIQWFEPFEWRRLDTRNHELACYARRRLCEISGCEPVTPEDREWFGWMVAVWLPAGNPHCEGLQTRLYNKYCIEVPIFQFRDRHLVRVSCHLYNSTHDIDCLVRALQKELFP